MKNYKVSTEAQIGDLNEIYLELIGYKTNGVFVDVGAYDGITWSDTACLADAGWKGLMIEPHPKPYKKCKDRYKGYPNIKCLEIAISNFNRKNQKIYIDGGLTTLKEDMVDFYNSFDWSKGQLEKGKFALCQVFTLNHILNKHKIPYEFDVLNIDVEGAEIDVLKGIDLNKWKPKIIFVELHKEEYVSIVHNMLIDKYEKVEKLTKYKTQKPITHPIYVRR